MDFLPCCCGFDHAAVKCSTFVIYKSLILGERFLGYRYISDIPYHVLDARAVHLRSPGLLKKFITGLSVERVTSVTEEYNLFFDRVCGDYGTLVKRKMAYLKWRYIDCPDKVHQMYAVKRFGKLTGRAVFSLKE